MGFSCPETQAGSSIQVSTFLGLAIGSLAAAMGLASFSLDPALMMSSGSRLISF
jgi:hypothetical protein